MTTGVKSERARKATERFAHKVRMAELHAKARAIVATGKCPQCTRALRRNLALPGWFQCVQFGSEQFRLDPMQPACSFQTFTE